MLKKIENEGTLLIALKSTRILDMQKQAATERISEMLTQVYYAAGQKLDGKDLSLLTQAVHLEVKNYFNFLRIEELRIALNEGVRGQYGEYFGINIKTIHGWIRSYQVSENRKQKLKELKTQTDDFKHDLNKVKADYWNYIIESVNRFKNGSKMEITNPLMMFREFWNNGLLKPTKDEVDEFKQRAVYELEKRRDLVKKALSPKEYREYHSLSAIIKGFEEDKLTKEQDTIIKSKAAELCLIDYFEKLDFEKFNEQVNAIINQTNKPLNYKTKIIGNATDNPELLNQK